MDGLDKVLRDKNPYARMYMSMRQVFEREQRKARDEQRNQVAVSMVIHGDRRTHDQRRYNSPTTNEVGVIFSTDGAPPENRDIRAQLLIPAGGSRIIHVSTTKRMCDPMTYPLLFPNGDDGWDPYMPYTTKTRAERDRLVLQA